MGVKKVVPGEGGGAGGGALPEPSHNVSVLHVLFRRQGARVLTQPRHRNLPLGRVNTTQTPKPGCSKGTLGGVHEAARRLHQANHEVVLLLLPV